MLGRMAASFFDHPPGLWAEHVARVEVPMRLLVDQDRPVRQLLVHRISHQHLDIAERCPECRRHRGVPLVERNRTVELTSHGTAVGSEPLDR
jgi:hypothetical protein